MAGIMRLKVEATVLYFLFFVSYFLFFLWNNRIRNKDSKSIENMTKSLLHRNSPGDEKSTGEKSEVIFTTCNGK